MFSSPLSNGSSFVAEGASLRWNYGRLERNFRDKKFRWRPKRTLLRSGGYSLALFRLDNHWNGK
jgi:hypothetical protein